MVDRITPTERSTLMSRVRGKDTKPELKVRRLLHQLGLRFRLHQRNLPGSPDIVLKRHRTAIFVNGCFWHGHEGCRRAKLPETRRDFWETKISRNIQRDSQATAELEHLGYRVLVLWECELKNQDVLRSVLTQHFGEKAMRHGPEITDG